MVQFEIDQRVKELYPPPILPFEGYQYEKSEKYGKKKRRCINPSYMPELRIMRHDIRRKYGDMFVNVSNHRDLGLMTRFVGEFLRPDCIIDRLTPANRNIAQICRLANSTPGVDIERFLYGFAMSCEMTPDKVHRLQECQIRTRQGSQGSIIVLKMLVHSVQLFTPDSLQIKRIENQLLSNELDRNNDHQNRSTTNNSDSSSSEELSQPSEDIQLPSSPIINKVSLQCNLSIVKVPVETVAALLMIMVLDENHFIHRLCIENKIISENLLVIGKLNQ